MIETLGLAQQLEASRLTSLYSLGILNTPPQRDFDEIAQLAALTCGTASAAVTLVDNDRVWLKARVCVDAEQVSRTDAFCSLEINSGELLLIPDTRLDPRSAGSPLALGPNAIRFYAGAPLLVGSGHCIGRLCVFDPKPRAGLSPQQRDALASLARMTVELIEAGRARQIGRVAAQVADVTSDAILCADVDGRITFWNRAAEAMFGHAASDALGASLDIIMPPELRAAHHAGFFKAAAGGPMTLVGRPVELTAIRSDGGRFPIELSLGRWQEGRTAAFAAIIRDVSSRKQLEHEREQTRAFLDTIIENLPAMLFVKDADSQRYLLMNKAGADIAGRPKADFPGRTDSELFPGVGEAYEARDQEACRQPGIHVFESEHVRGDGQRFNLRTKRLAIDAPTEGQRYLIGMTEDVTEARRAQAEVRRLGEYDALTGLRNRSGFIARLDEFTAAGTSFTLVAIHLDRFKAVNDQFGHVTGDQVLRQLSIRLTKCVASGDIVARTGGTEFVVVLAGADGYLRAKRIAPTIIAAMEEPVISDTVRAFSGASIGIAAYPDDGANSAEVRQATDLALHRAKQGGRNTICFYKETMDAALREHRQLEQALRQAVEKDEIEVAFQPVFSVQSGEISSFEALARWRHPTRGPVSPAEFISLAEECGIIEALGTSILCKACAEATNWPDDIRVAVNLSPLQFQTGRLCQSVREILDETGLPAHRLQLEVTEGLLIRDVERTFTQLEELRALGIQILMDDFGVGYSSLSYFQRFPFDKVKIDRSFVNTATTALSAQAIIRSVIQLGQALGMGIVAEGVETDEQRVMLASFGCTYLQGYLLGRPMPQSDVRAYLHNTVGATITDRNPSHGFEKTKE